jgi:filamentous hemagglutinin family protein
MPYGLDREDQRLESDELMFSQRTHGFLPVTSSPLARAGRAAALVSGASFLALAAGWSPSAAAATLATLPQGGQFVAGAGTIGVPGKGGLSINQTTTRGVIDWQSFSIGQGKKVVINNGSGATLNRVVGGDPSKIAGMLSSTGSVYVVNTAGVIVMPTGKVYTSGSFVATTRDVSNDAFMAGGAQNFKGTSAGSVVNQGTIVSAEGNVVLVGKSVTNNGKIEAANGSVSLAAGDNVLLQDGANETVQIAAGSGNTTNTGTIAAAQVQLAAADGNVYALATNNGGIIRATGTATKDGRVYLTADGDVDVGVGATVSAANSRGGGGRIIAKAGADGGMLSMRGTVDASATKDKKSGGTITLTADKVRVGHVARVSADGGGNGGTIFIGGDRHGGTEPAVALSKTKIANAHYTTINQGATISASGGIFGGVGDGGNVVVWSDTATGFYGKILTRGGKKGGNGGFTEVSGEILDYRGRVNTQGPRGKAGDLLLDPFDVTILSNTDNSGALSNLPGSTTVSGGLFTGGTFAPSGTSYILNTELDAQLAVSNVTINTGVIGTGGNLGNIHFGTSGGSGGSNAAPIYWSSNNSLTLNAVGLIDMPGGQASASTGGANPSAATTLIDALGTGNITFNASGNGVIAGGTVITVGGNTTAHGGTITLNSQSAGYSVVVGNGVTVTNSFVDSSHAGAVVLQADQVRLGVLFQETGKVTTTGNVVIEPTTAGDVVVGNNNNTSPYSSTVGNTALVNPDSIQNISADTLIIGSSAVQNLTIETPAGVSSFTGINASVNALEFLTGPNGSITQDQRTPIAVTTGPTTGANVVANGGLILVTGGQVFLPDFLNFFSKIAIKQLSGGSGGNIVVQGNSTDDNTGTLNITALNGISGISAPGANVTLVNIGTTTQDSGAAGAIVTGSLILEGGTTSPFADYLYFSPSSPFTYPAGNTPNINGAGITGFTGAFVLNNTSNQIGKIAGNVGSLVLADNTNLATASLSDNFTGSPTTINGINAFYSQSSGSAAVDQTGDVTITVNGKLTIASGAPITSALTTDAPVSVGNPVDPTAAGGIVLLEAGSPNYGDGTVAANTGFINNDATGISVSNGGYWRIYSQDPRNDSYGSLINTTTPNYAFVQYAAANYYGDPLNDTGTGTSASPSPFANANSVLAGNYTGTGNGFLYTVAPTVAVSLSGTFNKTYDGTTTVNHTLVAGDYSSVTGAINHDVVTLSEATGSGHLTYSSKNAGTWSISVDSDPTIASAKDGNNVQAFGYGIDFTNTLTGTISKAALTVTADDQTRTYGSLTGLQQGSGQTTGYSVSGLVNAETIGSITLTDNAAANNVATNAGTLTNGVAPSAATGGTFNPSNYSITYVNADVIINKAALTITAGDQSRTYGSLTGLQQGTGQTTGYSASGLVNGDTIGSVTLSDNAAANNVSTNAGTLSNAVTASAATGGTFSASNYSITYVKGGVTINKAALTITAGDQSRTYGSLTGLQQGTGQTTGYSASGLVNGDTIGSVTLSDNAAANNVSTNAGTLSNAVTASAATGGTFSASNYSITYVKGGVTINKAALTITAGDQSRTYGSLTGLQQGTGQTTGYSVSGLVNGDTIGSVTLSDNASANNVSTNAGTLSNAVSASAATGGTFSASNYAITYVQGDVTINKAALTITAGDQSRTYGSLTGLQQGTGQTTGYSVSGLVNGDTIGSVTLSDNASANNVSTNAGTLSNAVTASAATGGTFSASNYAITYVKGDVTINKAALSITATGQSRVYGSGTGLVYGTNQTTDYTVVGLQNGETVGHVNLSVSGASTAISTDVGTLTNAITASGAGGGTFNAANYNITYVQGNVAVTPKTLIVTAKDQSKIYGDPFTFTGAPSEFTVSGLVTANGDTVTAASLSSAGAAASANVAGSPYVINISGATGSGLSNYSIVYRTGQMTVTPRAIGATAIVVGGKRYYDGTPDAPGSILKITNLAPGDLGEVALSGTGIATSSDVGTWALSSTGGKLTGLTLTGAKAGDYTTTGGSGTLTIIPLPLILHGTRVYDGLTDGNASILSITNLIGSDAVTLVNGGTSTIASEHVGDRKIIDFTHLQLTGAKAGDYTLVGAKGDVVITPLPVIMTGTRVYDGLTDGNATILHITNAIGGDTVDIVQDDGTSTISSKHVGTRKIIDFGTLKLGNNGLGDYTLVGAKGTVIVTPLSIIATGTREYNGDPGVDGGILTVTNAPAGDKVTLTGTGTSDSPHKGKHPVNPGGLTIVGGPGTDPRDYTTTGGKVTVTITPRPVVLLGTRVYDGLTDGDGSILSVTNAVAGDTVDVDAGTSTIASKNVGHEGIVDFGTLSLGNNQHGDYTLVGASGTVIVTPLRITVSAVPDTKTYDGTTTSDGTPIVTVGKIVRGDTGDFIQTYGNKNAGNTVKLSPSGTVNDGNGGKNYIITYEPITVGGVIKPRPVSVNGTRPFDGNTDADGGILTIGGVMGGDKVIIAGGTGVLMHPNVGNEPIINFATLTLGGEDARNYYLDTGNVVVTATFTPPPENQTQSGLFSDAAFDSGILTLQPKQNGVVTGTIATNDGENDQPDSQLSCTLGDTGCLQNGIGTGQSGGSAK